MTDALLLSLSVSLGLTLVLELAFSLIWGLRSRDLMLVVLMNLLTNPAVVLLHHLLRSWPEVPVVIVLEAAAILVEGLCCRYRGEHIRHPWRFALLVNLFSYGIGVFL